MSMWQGKFVWYELMTTDTAAAEAFYRNVVGWTARDAGMPDKAYTILNAGEVPVGGVMAVPEAAVQMGLQPNWIGYIAVDDVDAYAADVTKAGGAVHRAPDDIPGVGRFAVVADPQGASFALFKGASTPPPAAAAPGAPGHGGWHELHAKELQAAFNFYATLFGWTRGEAMDMGPAGIYQLFSIAGEASGGMFNSPQAQASRPFWLFYFTVDAIGAAKARVEAGGGKVLNGPHQVPGGDWIIQCSDPQGAMFALVGPQG
jgi:predicted enzyme related to lactoylglutathione lyase